jgi:DNA-binding NarL/FixJ family response regulator
MDILIIDNSPILRHCIADVLRGVSGVEIIGEAQDAEEALTFCCNKKPGIVIMDISLRDGNGIDLLKEIKKKSSTRAIVFTNYPYPQYRKKCFEVGADYFFDKSSNFRDLVRIVEQYSTSDTQNRCRLASKTKEAF